MSHFALNILVINVLRFLKLSQDFSSFLKISQDFSRFLKVSPLVETEIETETEMTVKQGFSFKHSITL
jgi:hypothetical protein